MFAARAFVESAGQGYWGIVPTALTAAACALIYFKVIAKAKAEEASA
jgi:hypothetical protein